VPLVEFVVAVAVPSGLAGVLRLAALVVGLRGQLRLEEGRRRALVETLGALPVRSVVVFEYPDGTVCAVRRGAPDAG
jgi:hypothetical protein